MYRLSLFVLVGSLLVLSCESTVGLEPISGVEGNMTFIGEWNSDIQAATIIALYNLDLDNPSTYLVTYSNLIDPGTQEAEYFIQLLPGRYYLATVGITIDPGLFAVKLDSFLTAENIPLEIIDDDLLNLTTPITIEESKITRVDRGIVF